MDLPVYLKDQGEFARFYKAMFARQVQKQDGARRVPRVRVGHEMVRPVCRRPAVGRGTAPAGRVLGRRRGQAAERVPDAAARPLRQRAFPRGPRVSGDRRSRQLPGPVCPSSSVDRATPRAPPRRATSRVAERREAGSAASGVADRLDCRRISGRRWPRARRPGPAGRMVGTAVAK